MEGTEVTPRGPVAEDRTGSAGEKIPKAFRFRPGISAVCSYRHKNTQGDETQGVCNYSENNTHVTSSALHMVVQLYHAKRLSSFQELGKKNPSS